MPDTLSNVLIYYLIAYFIGAVTMLIVTWLTEKIENRRARIQALAACSNDDEIICENATIIEHKNGQISWIDNDTDILI